jgi:DNA-3-methyladenine glycosylase I
MVPDGKAGDGRIRCGWCLAFPAYMRYHDEEWGVPLQDDGRLFEFLILEGAQAGLSWSTILNKRAGYRRAFAGFYARKVARFGAQDVERLMQDAGIVRNRLKIESAISNARAFLAVQKEFGSFAAYLWQFTGGKPIINRWKSLKEVPASTPESDAMSRDLKKRGFRFVGSTICYAHMQATGMVNDHLTTCFRHAELGGKPAAKRAGTKAGPAARPPKGKGRKAVASRPRKPADKAGG